MGHHAYMVGVGALDPHLKTSPYKDLGRIRPPRLLIRSYQAHTQLHTYPPLHTPYLITTCTHTPCNTQQDCNKQMKHSQHAISTSYLYTGLYKAV